MYISPLPQVEWEAAVEYERGCSWKVVGHKDWIVMPWSLSHCSHSLDLDSRAAHRLKVKTYALEVSDHDEQESQDP